MKIVSFELENVKRVALVRLAPSESGLTVIGGDNCQGKTSVLDGIVYALGGEKYRPENLQREGSSAPARIRIEMTGGLVVERRGKNAALKVTDPSGRRAGQRLLDSFVEELALNLPKFLALRDDEKAMELLRIMGVDDKLAELDRREKAAYDRRHDYGVVADQRRKYADGLPSHPDAPDTPVSAAEIVAASEAAMRRNAGRARVRKEREAMEEEYARNTARLTEVAGMVAKLQAQAAELQARQAEIVRLQEDARNHPVEADEDTGELQRRLAEVEEVNSKVRANLEKAAAVADAEECERRLAGLTAELEAVREERRRLLDGAEMPLEGLSVGKDDRGRPVLLFNGQPWGNMSSMERIRVATAIVRRLKPECGFVLLDGMEAFDRRQLAAFDEWLQKEGLQAICTRVGREDCTIVIEDGVAVDEGVAPAPAIPAETSPIPEEAGASASEMDF